MKTIEMSDGDYNALMELTKELQLQDNISQAFPYFWSPRSTKKTIGTDDDTPLVYDDCETSTLEEYAEDHEDVFIEFLKENELDEDSEYDDGLEWEWQSFIESYGDLRIVYERDEHVIEANHSLFHSDVKQFIECNSHHLGEKPHTYANSIWRMPKMQKLVGIIYRINRQPKEDVNHEARRFIYADKA